MWGEALSTHTLTHTHAPTNTHTETQAHTLKHRALKGSGNQSQRTEFDHRMFQAKISYNTC